VGLPGRAIISSKGLHLHLHRTTQHRQTKDKYCAVSGIQTRDPAYERSRLSPQTARPLEAFDSQLNKSTENLIEGGPVPRDHTFAPLNSILRDSLSRSAEHQFTSVARERPQSILCMDHCPPIFRPKGSPQQLTVSRNS
jgi:hypothetical protein